MIQRKVEEWPAENNGQLTTVSAIESEISRTHAKTEDFLNATSIEDFNRIVQVPGNGTPKLGWILWHVLEQQIHHRGELFLCLSLMGKDRPKIDRPS